MHLANLEPAQSAVGICVAVLPLPGAAPNKTLPSTMHILGSLGSLLKLWTKVRLGDLGGFIAGIGGPLGIYYTSRPGLICSDLN